jgi:hypothetical protein
MYCFIQNSQKHRRDKENTKENKPPKFRITSLKEQQKQGQWNKEIRHNAKAQLSYEQKQKQQRQQWEESECNLGSSEGNGLNSWWEAPQPSTLPPPPQLLLQYSKKTTESIFIKKQIFVSCPVSVRFSIDPDQGPALYLSGDPDPDPGNHQSGIQGATNACLCGSGSS